MLFSCYRQDQFQDPEGFLASLGLVLEQYPDEVIKHVTDPRTGIQRRSKWPPSIAEIVEACDECAAGIKRRERFANWGHNDPLAIEGPPVKKLTEAEMVAKYGKGYGLAPVKEEKLPLTEEEITTAWAKVLPTYAADPSRLARLLNNDLKQGE